MAAVMRILGWKAVGLRCPDHEIDCVDAKGKPSRVTLVQMPNGTGKTTTLALLRAALSGEATGDAWNREVVLEFAKRGPEAPDRGIFEVRLLLNDRKATFIMEFDFENARVSYKTTYGSGQKAGFQPPSEFRRFLSRDFIHFFVFDGELAQRLLDRTKTNAEAAVEALFQTNVFAKLGERVKEYWDDRTNEQTATEERGKSRRENRVKELEGRLKTLKADQSRLKQKRDDVAARLKAKEDAYNQEIKKDESISKAIGQAEVTHERLKADVRDRAGLLLDAMREPYAMSAHFARSISDLRLGLDKVKLPERAAREFFEELAEEEYCVCGRPIDDHIRDAIRAGAKHYLGSDDVSLLNMMKTSIHEAVGDSPADPERALCAKIAALEDIVAEERDASNSLDGLKLEAEQSDPAVKQAKEDIEALQNELDQVDQELEKFDSKDDKQGDGHTFGIDVLERRHKDAERKLAEITQTIELKEKRDILLSILQKAHATSRQAIATEICRDTNRRIGGLMPHNNLSIDRIDRSLVLAGQGGGSVGETLSIAYAFLATLFDRSDHKLPFIVDSPAGAIDLAVRPKVGELIPRLSDQFVAFTISSERERFVPSLEKACKTKLQFLTLFRKGSKDLQKLARAQSDFEETTDGFLVRGRDFFNDFQMDEENS
jgi:DNA sulfur modification protein DndD